MDKFFGIDNPHKPNWEGLIDTIMRRGEPDRVYHIELFLDSEMEDAVAERFGLTDNLDPNDEWFAEKKYLAVQRFMGYDYARTRSGRLAVPFHSKTVEDTADLARGGGRSYQDEHTGPITNWDEFEQYDWPDPVPEESEKLLDWYDKNLPDDMCIIASGTGHFCEFITWLMGYETLCYALMDDRKLVGAIADKMVEFHRVQVKRFLEYNRVKAIWGSDDMGFRTGTLISPDDLREFVFPGHKMLAEMSHDAGRPYLLHSCGNLVQVFDDLVDDIKIDAKHSFEDTIEDVRELKGTLGQRTALLGGIDLDFLCRAGETDIRERVRNTLDVCQPGGAYCLGTGNSVTNYIPIDSYLAMVDEGMRYSG
jgi:uroporphyrinogen decarboxylase